MENSVPTHICRMEPVLAPLMDMGIVSGPGAEKRLRQVELVQKCFATS